MKIAMTILFGFAAAVALAAEPVDSAASQKPVAPTAPLQGYSLVWADEFNGNSLDVSKWEYRTDSKHWSTQRSKNVSVGDGMLRIALKKEKAGDKNYTGGGVISRRQFKHGYYEARFQCAPGAGWHTSFWMMAHGGHGDTGTSPARQELDVCETDSVHLRTYAVNVHRWNPQPHKTFGTKSVKTPDLSAGFHVWGCEFTPKTVKYFFDGRLVQTVDATQFEHGEQNIWLTVIASQLGGAKAVDDGKLPAVVEFDYIRFFEKKTKE